MGRLGLRSGLDLQLRSLADKARGAPVLRDGTSVASASGTDAWRSDKDKYWEMHKLPGARQPRTDLAMGAYATTMQVDPVTKKVTPVSKFFVSPRDDPVTFVVC